MNILEIDNISKNYGKLEVLKDISFSISSGEIVGLLGLNGAGKTTLMNCITGITKADNGVVNFNDENLFKNKILLNKFGVSVNPVFLNYLSIYDNLKVLGIYSGLSKEYLKDEIPRLINFIGLKGKEKAKPEELSFGQLEKLGIIQALIGEKKVLILDEPTTGQDYKGINILKEELKNLSVNQGIIILLSSHDYDFLENICDRIIIIHRGRIIFNNKFKNSKKYNILIENSNEDIDLEVDNLNEIVDILKKYPNENIEKIYEKIVNLEDFFKGQVEI